MSMDAAHRRWWQITEVVLGVPLLAGLALQLAVPLSIPRGVFTPATIVLGVTLFLAGVTLVVLARREFAQHGQPTDPGRPTSQIVTTGVFSVSRNPIYLGAAGCIAGIGLALNLPWVLIMLLPGLAACQYILIAPEERYLAAKFSGEYRAYTDSVQRWIGRIKS